jgi:hypothetical protein
MATPKASTLQQKFGFTDADLKSPNHDIIMMWLNENIEDITKKISNWSDEWKPEMIKEVRDEGISFLQNKISELERRKSETESDLARLSDDANASNPMRHLYSERLEGYEQEIPKLYLLRSELDNISPKPPFSVNVKWEQTVMSNKFIIGFIDMVVFYPDYGLYFSNNYHINVHGSSQEYSVCFEVKTSIPSLGELIRQINMYREYVKSPFYIVASDKKFISQLQSQRIGFVHYPSGEVFSHDPR